MKIEGTVFSKLLGSDSNQSDVVRDVLSDLQSAQTRYLTGGKPAAAEPSATPGKFGWFNRS